MHRQFRLLVLLNVFERFNEKFTVKNNCVMFDNFLQLSIMKSINIFDDSELLFA